MGDHTETHTLRQLRDTEWTKQFVRVYPSGASNTTNRRRALCAVVQSLSCVRLSVIPWTEMHQASLSFTISWSLLKLMTIESVMLSNHLILCCSLLLLPSVFPSIRVFSNELALRIRWLSVGTSASASVLEMNIQD